VQVAEQLAQVHLLEPAPVQVHLLELAPVQVMQLESEWLLGLVLVLLVQPIRCDRCSQEHLHE
jgi:hypothetical protein